MRKLKTAFVAIALLGTSPVVAGTVRSITASEKAAGAKAHPQLLDEFGGAYAGSQAAYVEKVGRHIAVQSGLANSEKEFTVTLLNSSVNNAFAIPGGYVYVTRQLLALMNDEAELAAVLGHEVGHVAARHSAKRNTTATIGNILAAGLGVVTGQEAFGQLAGYGAQLYTLRFSRSQEYKADKLGIRYLGTAGYDPLAAADLLASLGAITTVEAQALGRSGKDGPDWMSTHPNNVDRVAQARKEATAGVATAKGTARNRDTFLAAIDGMIYDDDPKQGVVDGQTFRHPELRFQFTAPTGFAIVNGQSAVTIAGTGGQAQLSGGKIGDGGLAGYIDRVIQAMGNGQTRISYSDVRQDRINGIETASATARGSTQSGPVDATVTAYRYGNGSAYHFLTITAQGSGLGPFKSMIDSFRAMSAEEAASVKPRRVRVVTVKSGDKISSLAGRMAYATLKTERFLALNGLAANAQLKAGQKIKLIVVE